MERICETNNHCDYAIDIRLLAYICHHEALRQSHTPASRSRAAMSGRRATNASTGCCSPRSRTPDRCRNPGATIATMCGHIAGRRTDAR